MRRGQKAYAADREDGFVEAMVREQRPGHQRKACHTKDHRPRPAMFQKADAQRENADGDGKPQANSVNLRSKQHAGPETEHGHKDDTQYAMNRA